MLATVAAADSASTVIKKYSVFIYSAAEPRAMYAIYKQTLTLCVLQYIIRSKKKWVYSELVYNNDYGYTCTTGACTPDLM